MPASAQRKRRSCKHCGRPSKRNAPASGNAHMQFVITRCALFLLRYLLSTEGVEHCIKHTKQVQATVLACMQASQLGNLSQVRFFERVKLERRIKRLEAAAQAARVAGSEVTSAHAAALAQAHDDLQVRFRGLPPEQRAVLFPHRRAKKASCQSGCPALSKQT